MTGKTPGNYHLDNNCQLKFYLLQLLLQIFFPYWFIIMKKIIQIRIIL